MITIMNMFNIIMQHTIKIFKYHPPCRQMCFLHFCSPNYTTNLCSWSWFKLNSNVSLNLDASLSISHSCYGCTWNCKIACTINNKSAKLTSNSQYSSPHTHIMIYCNKLNSGCCLSIDSVNVNKSWKVNILLLSKTIYDFPTQHISPKICSCSPPP